LASGAEKYAELNGKVTFLARNSIYEERAL